MKSLSGMVFYSLADAKKEFSNVINQSRLKDIIITKNGKPVSVIVDYEKYTNMMEFVSKMYDLYLVDLGSKDEFAAINGLSVEDILNSDDENDQEV